MSPGAHPSQFQVQQVFPPLPQELFLNVLDQLVEIGKEHRPIAYEPSHPITRTLRALTLVSRSIYPIASKHLYIHCLYLDNITNYSRFRRTLGLNLGNHPQALHYGQPVRHDELFTNAGIQQHIKSIFVSPFKSDKDSDATPLVRLPQIIDLCNTLGPTLKRLALDLTPVYSPGSEVELIRPHISENSVFLNMPHLEELVVSFDVTDYFPYPPPNLKRLAITVHELGEAQVDFCFSSSSLEKLFLLRPPDLEAKDIDVIFKSYQGKSLDVVLVDVNANHRTPRNTRHWKSSDVVRMWEVDVPTSYYGDNDALVLCDSWIWTHGVRGTLWDQKARKMKSWKEVRAMLAVLDLFG